MAGVVQESNAEYPSLLRCASVQPCARYRKTSSAVSGYTRSSGVHDVAHRMLPVVRADRMARYRFALPQFGGEFFLTDGGIETTLIFHKGLELLYPPRKWGFGIFADADGRHAEETRDPIEQWTPRLRRAPPLLRVSR